MCEVLKRGEIATDSVTMGSTVKNSDKTASLRILVVEDQSAHFDIICRAFESQNGDVRLENARTIGEARRKIAESSQDLVIADLCLPDGEAFELLPMHGRDGEIPVVLITAHGNEAKAVRAIKAGAVDYLVKSEQTFADMPRTVRNALHEWKAVVESKREERELAKRNAQLEHVAQQLRDSNSELALQARVDRLTWVLNRGAWQESAQLEHERSRRYSHPYGVVMIDVDYFKAFNDAQGHLAGDDCLRQVAAAIVSACRSIDIIGRYGGEEFVVMMPETDGTGALAAAERLQNAVCELAIPHAQSATAEYVTASFGVASSRSDSLEDTLKAADAALYAAKESGRNRVCAGDQVVC